MRSDRYLASLDRLLAAARAVPVADDGADFELELGELVPKPWRKLREAVHALDDDPPDQDLHAVRIRAKRAATPPKRWHPRVGKEAKRFATAVEAVQEVLGEHQDAVVAGEWLREHVPPTTAAPRSSPESSPGRSGRRAGVARRSGRQPGRTRKHPKLRRWM